MMAPSNIPRSDHAKDNLRLAGQSLSLLGFKVNVAAPTFSPLFATYHDMLDPSSDESTRLRAAGTMLEHVRRQIVREDIQGEDDHARKRPADTYGLVWQTTERGAALFMIDRLLSEAIAVLNGQETSVG